MGSVSSGQTPHPQSQHERPDAAAYRVFFHAVEQACCLVRILVDAEENPVDARIVDTNRAFDRLARPEPATGRPVGEIGRLLGADGLDTCGRVALGGEATRFVAGDDHGGRRFEVHAAPTGSRGDRLVALVFSDITTAPRETERETAEHETAERETADRESGASSFGKTEQRFRELADAAPAMLWVTEPDGSCTFLSRAWYEFTGQTEAEGLGFGWLDAVHPEDRPAAREHFLRANEARMPYAVEHRLRRRDGAYRWVIDGGRPRTDANGRFAGFVGSVIDIHDRRMAEHRLELAVTSSNVGLWYCDLPFDVLVWSPQVKAHFGLPEDAIVTIDVFFDRLHPDDREPTRLAIEEAIANNSRFDTRYRTVGLDGRTRWIRALGGATYDEGRAVSFDGITVDVTELVALREEAEAASRAKDEFLAMLGHELRNPLAPIVTALQLLKLRGIDQVERERALIERQVQHLVSLVDDLLDVSRITRGGIDLRRAPIELADVVARAVEIASPLIEQQRHHLDVNVPHGLVVNGDLGRLAQVVANLLTNAAKYTEAGGRIHVSADVQPHEIALRVRDSGTGIDADMLPHVFNLFVQERQSIARSRGGLGLGLAIVRSLVDLHGGRVSAHSAGRGAGSEFVVRLPRLQQDGSRRHADDGATAAVAAPPVGGRVLVVDDNRDAAALLGELVQAFGYAVRVVHDAPSALEEAARFAPQVALVDIGLPVMDGYELAERFATDAALQRTALVAVTGYGQQHDRERTARAGFRVHLVKPVDGAELQQTLANLLPGKSRTGSD